MPTIAYDELEAFAGRILNAAGLADADAAAIAACLVFANLRGVDSHGALRLIQYADTIRGGHINPEPQVQVLDRRGALALVDADGGYGFRPCIEAVELAIDLARSHGIGAVGVRNSHHLGMAATYPMRAAEAGVIGLLLTTTSPVIAPPGGARPVVGNNPIACAVPRVAPHPPIVLDMALSEVAFGRIRLAAAEGSPIPAGWAYDTRGRVSTDAEEAVRARMLAAIGGHKGYGLSVIAELLAGVLTGSPFGLDSGSHKHRGGGGGHLLIAVDPEAFVDRETFNDGVERLVAQIRAVPLAEGAQAVYLPGEIEWNTFVRRRHDGIPVSAPLAAKLEALAAELCTAPPNWNAGEP